jgi:hypothetical protein
MPIRWANRLRWLIERSSGRVSAAQESRKREEVIREPRPKGTFVRKNSADGLKREIGSSMLLEILVWRSVSVRFLRALIHPRLGGGLFLRLLFWLEERFPHFFGENGQYPLIVIRKM